MYTNPEGIPRVATPEEEPNLPYHDRFLQHLTIHGIDVSDAVICILHSGERRVGYVYDIRGGLTLLDILTRKQQKAIFSGDVQTVFRIPNPPV